MLLYKKESAFIVHLYKEEIMATKITLQCLLSSPMMKTETLFTTSVGMTNRLSSINIMDIPDIEKWLKGEELLVIGKFMKSHFNKTFIEELKHRHVGAILSKKKYRPFLTEDMIDLLRYYNIPLILIDNHFSWSDVTITFQEVQIAKNSQALIESEYFIKQIIQYFSDNHSLNNLCQIVYETTKLSIAIVNQDMNLIDHSNDWS